MSRGAGPRGRRSRRAPSGGLLAWTLSLPARLHLRWLVILLVTGVAMGAYGRVLLTAPPMPPSRAPATAPAATPAATLVPSAAATPTSEVG
ncbi:hypothetical protein [Actinacidiphila acidipaludis]|uniref:Uncharacterized protein n=1 Tax=Actinacidiphila acidipaludis TaxID=2873382 RepID=A0ABS7QHA4_9ACTN|nr:hypothetical protein [Streptomyces acidipaludis]MBY8881790.1 hypothetical protein [Streptomyces acidipaludis]